jgi:hypothetical protein
MPTWKRFETQQKEVTSIMEQQTREGIEATRRELEVQLAAVDSRSAVLVVEVQEHTPPQ